MADSKDLGEDESGARVPGRSDREGEKNAGLKPSGVGNYEFKSPIDAIMKQAMAQNNARFQQLGQAVIAANQERFGGLARQYMAGAQSPLKGISFTSQHSETFAAIIKLQTAGNQYPMAAAWKAMVGQQFRTHFLQNSRTIAQAFSTLTLRPQIQSGLETVNARPELTDWAETLDRVLLDPGEEDDAAAFEASTKALIETGEFQSLAASVATEPDVVEALLGVAAESIEAAGVEATDDDDGLIPPALSDDAAAMRTMMQTLAIGHVVVVCIVLGIVSGQLLVTISLLANLAQFTGLSLADLLKRVKPPE